MSDPDSLRHSTLGWYLDEPQLIFGDGKTFIDPKVGLQLYGPLRASEAKTSAPTSIKVGIVGTGVTISQTNRWLDRIQDGTVGLDGDPIQNRSFTGFKRIFSCDIVRSDEFNDLISQAEFQQIRRLPTFDDRVEKAVELFGVGLENVAAGSFRPDIVICALPDDVVNFCVVKRGSSEEPGESFLENCAN